MRKNTFSASFLLSLLRFLVKFFQIIDFLQDSCKFLATNVFPERIFQEMYWLEGLCKKCIDLLECHKDCIILIDFCKSFLLGTLFQDSCKKCILAELGFGRFWKKKKKNVQVEYHQSNTFLGRNE